MTWLSASKVILILAIFNLRNRSSQLLNAKEDIFCMKNLEYGVTNFEIIDWFSNINRINRTKICVIVFRCNIKTDQKIIHSHEIFLMNEFRFLFQKNKLHSSRDFFCSFMNCLRHCVISHLMREDSRKIACLSSLTWLPEGLT